MFEEIFTEPEHEFWQRFGVVDNKFLLGLLVAYKAEEGVDSVRVFADFKINSCLGEQLAEASDPRH